MLITHIMNEMTSFFLSEVANHIAAFKIKIDSIKEMQIE